MKQNKIKFKKANNTLEKNYSTIKNTPVYKNILKKNKKPRIAIKKIKKCAILFNNISIKNLANQLSEKVSEIIKILKTIISENKITEEFNLDLETAEILVVELGHEYQIQKNTLNIDLKIQEIQEEILKKATINKSPIVSVVGHVDHGKTSLLDLLSADETKEAGDITQSLRTFSVNNITFIDTPGHSVFSTMRESAIEASDIVIILISIEDGLKEQTIESIKIAKNKKLVIAINKIDKLNKEQMITKIRQIEESLLQYNIITINMGGYTPVSAISTKNKIGIEDLYQNIHNVAEEVNLLYLKECTAFGVILDSQLNKHQGIGASLILQQGTLKTGDYITTPTTYAKIKATDTILEGGKAYTLYKFNDFAISKEPFIQVESEREANKIISYYQNKNVIDDEKLSLNELISQKLSLEKNKKLNLIIKSNSWGSLESIVKEINKIQSDDYNINIIIKSIGEITQSEIEKAQYFDAEIITFGIKTNNSTKQIAKKAKIDIREFQIIYHIFDYLNNKIKENNIVIEKDIISQARIKAIFEFSAKKIIAGCDILNGIFSRTNLIQIIRDKEIIGENLKIRSMMMEKNEVNEGRKGQEIGFLIHNFNDFQKGDIIESYKIK